MKIKIKMSQSFLDALEKVLDALEKVGKLNEGKTLALAMKAEVAAQLLAEENLEPGTVYKVEAIMENGERKFRFEPYERSRETLLRSTKD